MWNARALFLMVILVLFIVCSFLITPILSQNTTSQSIQSHGEILDDVQRLRASGTTIINGFGNKVILVGSQITWNEYSKGWFSIEDLQTMKSYGGNIVEISTLRFKDLVPERNVIDETYFVNNLDKWISWAEQMKIYVLIDLRNFKWTSFFGAGMPDWMLSGHDYGSPPYDENTNDQAVRDFWDIDNPLHNDNRHSFINLWKFIANRYKDNQYVLFGIVNEPLCLVPLDSTQASHLGTTYSRFMEQVVDAIRSVGAEQLIFIDRPYVTGVEHWYDNLQPVNRPNIVWEDHAYVGPDFNIDQWKERINGQMIRKFARDFQKPFFVGEYSPYPINISDWRNILAEQVAFLKSLDIAGYVWHTWGFLEGEYYDYEINYLTQEESNYILQTIYG